MMDKLKGMLGISNSTDQNQLTMQNAAGTLQSDLDKFMKDMQQMQHAGGIVSQPAWFMGTPFPALSQAEELELAHLEAENLVNVKAAKLNQFKSLPKEFRQTVINLISWDEERKKINETLAPGSDRLLSLRARKVNNGSFFGGLHHHTSFGHGSGHWPPEGLQFTPVLLPEGITREELVQAHLDASLDEELVTEEGGSQGE